MSEGNVLDFGSMATPTLEAPSPADEHVETPVETPTEEPVETPTEEHGEPGGEKEAGGAAKPPTLKQVREAVNAFTEANPELGKHLKAMLANEGRIRAYQEVYPDVEAARSMKAAIEAAGGVEGITKLRDLEDFVDNVNSQWDSGDPAALEPLFEDGGDGAVKIFPHYMNRVEKANPEAFGAAIRPHFVRNLEGANFPGTVGAILRALSNESADPKQLIAVVRESVASMAEWFQDQKRQAEKSNLDALEPERKKFQERETALANRETKQFESQVQEAVKPEMNQLIGKYLSPYAEALNAMPERSRQGVMKAWLEEMGSAFGKDYHDNVAAMMKSKTRNTAAIANYAKSRMQAVAQKVTEKIVKDFKLVPGKQKAAAGGGKEKGGEKEPTQGAGSIGSPIRVKERPSDDQIDWDADPTQVHFVSGKAKLKTGSKQWVKWR